MSKQETKATKDTNSRVCDCGNTVRDSDGFCLDCKRPNVAEATEVDIVNHPPHCTSRPSGVDCITAPEHMGFNLGNALKYIWRADLKGDAITDLFKARWYIEREIAKRQKGNNG
jgi:hypothetical protein